MHPAPLSLPPMTPKRSNQGRSPFSSDILVGSNNLSTVPQRASDGYQIIQEYQALTKNGSRRGEEMSCKSQLDQILTERCKKSLVTSSNKMIANLLGNKKQQVIISPRNSSLRRYVREHNTSHHVDKVSLQVDDMLPPT